APRSHPDRGRLRRPQGGPRGRARGGHGSAGPRTHRGSLRQMMEAAASSPAVPEALAEATRHQPRARAALLAALASPGHAYIFRGPRGAGKAAAARAFAEI